MNLVDDEIRQGGPNSRPTSGEINLCGWRIATTAAFLLFLAALTALLADRALALAMLQLPARLRSVASFVSLATHPAFVLLFLLMPILISRTSLARVARCWTPKGMVGESWTLFSNAVLALLACLALHLTTGRAAPGAVFDWNPIHFEPFSLHLMSSTLPSAHAAVTALLACSMAMRYPRLELPLLTAAVLTCLAPPTACLNWTSDIIVGWAIGSTIALLSRWRNSP
ncbi:hypothetical protein ELG72_37665 [Rhizobium leguminosarum]|uniref:phosphatase PAP2 family protein n=1 Tax=Rhizobium TaxID=379 RepID=UPI00103211C7|nr:phosphatase PAP2 family protein [Rhizobium leguminosarum]TBF87884.1 hypothetical protein ELG82_37435 [Rhizobium leguminosarum]TBG07135.1 hypothetical protein ELG80_37260 [Rhizobium leguminosarum]TBG07699.1 hypothetical protein ELG81_37565 [Rhizobium leguminosarum]TBG30819.1 hypothetical protein ELG75_36960 [Rhizobium leguminosarum]TBG50065.1 hypothetical protein ELG72_37665 [Rhizobium leguminosarum]